jgi:hypothetical protein
VVPEPAALLIYRQTHSALLLGVLNFSQFLPILLLAPWAGAASDRWNRRHLLLVTQPISIALSAGLGLLAYLDLAPPAVVIADAAALGVVSAFSAPAQQAMIPSLVEESEVPTAVALNSMTFNLARAIGPASAALAVEYLGIPAAFGLNALSYLIFVGALLLIGPRPQELAERAAGGQVRASVDLLRRRPQLVIFLVIVAAVGFASDPGEHARAGLGQCVRQERHLRRLHRRRLRRRRGDGCVRRSRPGRREQATHVRDVDAAGRRDGRVRAHTLACARPAGAVRRGLRLPRLEHARDGAAPTRGRPWERGRVMALWSVAFLGLRPFASLLDGALAGAFGVRVAAIVLALPALGCAAWVAVRARTRGWGPARAEIPPA